MTHSRKKKKKIHFNLAPQIRLFIYSLKRKIGGKKRDKKNSKNRIERGINSSRIKLKKINNKTADEFSIDIKFPNDVKN